MIVCKRGWRWVLRGRSVANAGLMAVWAGCGNALHKTTHGLLLVSMVSWHHQELPTCLWPSSPPPVAQPSSFVQAPCSAEKNTALQQGWGQRRIVSLQCWCQGRVSWQTRNRLSSTLRQAKWAVLGSITHKPADMHHELGALFPEDGASHEGHLCLSLCS